MPKHFDSVGPDQDFLFLGVHPLEMPPNCSIRNNVLIPKPIPGFILSEPGFGIIIPQNHCQPGS